MSRRVLEAAGIDRIDAQDRKLDIHALRGTCASRLVRNNVPVAVTQRMLGHASPTMTMKHYVRLELDDMRQAVERARPKPVRRIEESA